MLSEYLFLTFPFFKTLFVSHHFLLVGAKSLDAEHIVFTVPLTKKMQTTLVERYLTVARHHGVGAGPSLNDMQVGHRLTGG